MRNHEQGAIVIDTTQGVRLADAPPLGEYWKGQGGRYAGVLPDYAGNQPRVLILAEDEAIGIAWGGYGAIERDARDKGDGQANTQALVNCRVLKHVHDAARFAASYEKDGHQDFYLPSKRELDAVYVTVRDVFDTTDWYWSSTEQSEALALGRHFGGANVEGLFKHMPGRATAVRTVPIIADSADPASP